MDTHNTKVFGIISVANMDEKMFNISEIKNNFRLHSFRREAAEYAYNASVSSSKA
jgi:hypothetical protein